MAATVPDTLGAPLRPNTPLPIADAPSVPVQKSVPRLTKEMRRIATARLNVLRWELLDRADECEWGMTLSEGFLPDSLVKTLLDSFPTLTGVSALPAAVRSFTPLAEYLEALWDVIQELQEEFEDLRAAKKELAAQQREERREHKRCEVLEDVGELSEMSEADQTEPAQPLAVRTAGKIRIPGGRFCAPI